MPFKSQAQRAWMHANHPEMAKEWEKHTPKGKKLPEHVKKAYVLGLGMKLAVAMQPQAPIAPGVAAPPPKIAPAGAPQPAPAPAPANSAPAAPQQAPPPQPGDPNRPPANTGEAVQRREEQKRQQLNQQLASQPKPGVPSAMAPKLACARLRQDLRKVAVAAVAGAPELTPALDKPVVRDYLAGRDARRKTKQVASNWKLPVMGAGAIAAGAGLHHLGSKMLSPDDNRLVDDFLSLESKDVGGNSGLSQFLSGGPRPSPANRWSPGYMYDYIDRASAVSRVKPYGVSVPDLILKVRKNLTGGAAVDANDQAAVNGAMEHYRAFANGPVPAYMHQYEKYTKAPWDPQRQSDDLFPRPLAGDAPTRMDEMPEAKAMLPEQRVLWHKGMDALRADPSKLPIQHFVNKHHALMNEYLHLPIAQGGAGLPATVTPENIHETVNHSDQMDIIKKSDQYIATKDPAFAAAKNFMDRRLSEGQHGAVSLYKTYANLGRGLLQDAPKALGIGLGVAGAAGIIWWLLKRREAAKNAELDKAERAGEQRVMAKAAVAMPTSLAGINTVAALQALRGRPLSSRLDVDDLLMPAQAKPASKLFLGLELPADRDARRKQRREEPKGLI